MLVGAFFKFVSKINRRKNSRKYSENLDKIKIEKIINNFENRYLNAQKKYEIWIHKKKDILPFFKKEPTTQQNFSLKILFLISDFNFLFKKIFKINYFY
mgnify:CR=1 FL=1